MTNETALTLVDVTSDFTGHPLTVLGDIVEVETEPVLQLYPALKQSTDLASWKMPKWGKNRADCGEIIYVVTCEDKHEPVLHGLHCYRPECPVCYEYWANREAKSATERIEVVKKLYFDAGKQIGNPKHVIFSPPQEWAIGEMNTLEGFKKLRSKCNQVAKNAGFMGGCLIFHSHRKKHLDDHTNCEKDKCQREHIWVISPHFHSVGYGFLQNAKVFSCKTAGYPCQYTKCQLKTGKCEHFSTEEERKTEMKKKAWIYKNKGVRKTVFGTVKYLLTHCGLGYVGETRKIRATTWYGILGCNQLMIASEKILHEPQYCEECGGHQLKWLIGGDDGHLMPVGEYIKKTRIRTYRLRKLPYRQTMVCDDFG